MNYMECNRLFFNQMGKHIQVTYTGLFDTLNLQVGAFITKNAIHISVDTFLGAKFEKKKKKICFENKLVPSTILLRCLSAQ